jgi:hypothetical protein
MRIGTVARTVVRVLLIALVLALMVVPTACSESESISGTSVSVSMADREVKQDESFTLEVRIETDTACRGMQCALTFDPALMKCDSVVEGGFFKDWATANGASTVMIPQSPTIDNNQGHVPMIGIAVMGGGGGGAKGSGVLFTYHFTALDDGTASPTLSDVVVIDASGEAIAEVEVNN